MFANKLVDPLVSDLRFGAVHSDRGETTPHPLQSQVRYLTPIQLAQSVRSGASFSSPASLIFQQPARARKDSHFLQGVVRFSNPD